MSHRAGALNRRFGDASKASDGARRRAVNGFHEFEIEAGA